MSESTHESSATPSTKTKRAVIYLRAASAHQADQAAIEAQRAACQALAARYDLTITDGYNESTSHHLGKEV